MFPPEKTICLTWSGGAGAVLKTDWTPLFMRDIIIWPDNDKVGFEASTAICQLLRRVGASTLREVDRGLLAKYFPPKWDLADPLPQGKNDSLIKGMILRSHEKAVGLKALTSYLQVNGINVDVAVANQILSQVEEKLRPTLERKLGEKNSAVKIQILEEIVSTLRRSKQADYANSGNISKVVKETDIVIDQHKTIRRD